MTLDTLWSARLRLKHEKPPVILDDEMITAICRAYVEAHETLRIAERLCREEVLNEREACAVAIVEFTRFKGALREGWTDEEMVAAIRARR